MTLRFTAQEIEEDRLERLNEYSAHHMHYDCGPGTYSYHEAVDRSSIFCNLLEYLMDHPAVLWDSEAYRLAYEAHTSLFNLYQYLGVRHIEAPSVEDAPCGLTKG